MKTERTVTINRETDERSAAVIMDANRVLGWCETAQTEGGHIVVAWGGMRGKSFVNAEHLCISRKGDRLRKEQECDNRYFEMHVTDDGVPYFVPEKDEPAIDD